MSKAGLKKGKFIKVSREKAIAEHNTFINNQKRECIQDGFDLNVNYLKMRDYEEEIKIKEEQMINGISEEIYNGMIKPLSKISTELALLKCGYNRLLIEVKNNLDKFEKVHKLSSEDTNKIMLGDFYFNSWLRDGVLKEQEEESNAKKA